MLRRRRLKAVVFLLCLWLYLLLEYAMRVSDSVIIPDLQNALGVGAFGIGLLSSSYYYAYVAFQIPAGILLSRYHFQKVLALATLALALSAILFSLSKGLLLAVLARLLMGLASSFAFIASVKWVREYFNRHAAVLIGFCMTIATLGAVLGQAPWYFLYHLSGDWRANYYYVAAIAFLLSLYFFFYRSNDLRGSKSLLKVYGAVFSDGVFWRNAIFIGTLSAQIIVLSGLWVVPFLTIAHDFSRENAAIIASMGWVGGLFGGPILGFLAEKTQRPKMVLLFSALIALLCVLLLVYLTGCHAFFSAVLMFCIGFVCNANVIVFALLTARYPLAAASFVVGVANVFNMGIGAILQFCVGYFLSRIDVLSISPENFRQVLWIVPLCLVLGVFLLMSREKPRSGKMV